MLLEIYETFTQEQYEKIKKIDELIISNDWNLISLTDKYKQYQELKKLIDDFGDNNKLLINCFEKLQDNIRSFGVELPIEKESVFKELVYKIEYYKILNEGILKNRADKSKGEDFKDCRKILKQLCDSKKTYATVFDNIVHGNITLKPFMEYDTLLLNLIDNIELCVEQRARILKRFYFK